MSNSPIWKSYDFDNLTEFFNYILGSHTNGNFTQVARLISKLSKQQQAEFIRHCTFGEVYFDDRTTRYCIDITLTQLATSPAPLQTTKEQAIAHLKTIDPTTVIDWQWNEYLEQETREALNTLCETDTYYDVTVEYEGYTLSELIDAFTPPTITIYCDNTNTHNSYPSTAEELEALQTHIAKFLKKNSYVNGRVCNNLSDNFSIIR